MNRLELRGPELLFGVLVDVRGIYRRDLDAADALLDDLITYLRAALPQMRSEASTVDREVALAEAHLKPLPAARAPIDVRPAVEGERLTFARMVLLPMDAAGGDALRAADHACRHAANEGMPMEVTDRSRSTPAAGRWERRTSRPAPHHADAASRSART